MPLVVGVSTVNVRGSEGLKPLVAGHQMRYAPHCGRYFKPHRLYADKAHDVPHLRKWLHGKRIGVRIARKGIESGKPSRHRQPGLAQATLGKPHAPGKACPGQLLRLLSVVLGLRRRPPAGRIRLLCRGTGLGGSR